MDGNGKWREEWETDIKVLRQHIPVLVQTTVWTEKLMENSVGSFSLCSDLLICVNLLY